MTDEPREMLTNGIQERWTAAELDTYFGHCLSELTECDAPYVPEMPDYYVEFASIRAVVSPDFYDNREAIRVLTANFLRRSVIANMEYRDGCHAIREYLAWLPESTAISIHAMAVARFEGCLLQASAAQACLNAMVRTLPKVPASYVHDDNTAYDRLNKLANRIRHHHDDVIEAAARRDPSPLPVAPIWLTNTGIMSRKNTRTYGLTYRELAAILADASAAARMTVESTLPRP